MLRIGATDQFERKYMERFRAFAAGYGEFVYYEHDRGARDIGVHLTQQRAGGGEVLSGPLCWFQMKGLMAATLPAEQIHGLDNIKISLKVAHLRYWLLQPVPTYLAVYVESIDEFFILNITRYTEERWGRDILTLGQGEATVEVPVQSRLDDQAFKLILLESDVSQWAKALGSDETTASSVRKDYKLIWRLGTAKERGVEHQVVFWDWQSKTRSQFWFNERAQAARGDWTAVREHWQFMMDATELEAEYPYIEFGSPPAGSPARSANQMWAGALWLGDPPPLVMANGDTVLGFNYADEYYQYEFSAHLNQLGQDLFESVVFLEKLGLIEIDPNEQEVLSTAPWHSRSV